MKKFLAFILSASALTFVACGDDVTKVYENSGIATLEPGKKLSKQDCDSTNVGEFLFVKDSSATFMCDGKSWVNMKGGDDKDSKGSSENGGSACTVKKVSKDKRTGYALTCGKDVVDTLWNGKDGGKGDSGDNGAGCKVASDKDGVVKLVCGEGKDADTTKFFKAVCGSNPYDPAEKFCFEGTLEKLCKGKAYNLSNEICKDGKVVALCGGKTFDSSKKFCFNDELVNLCGGKSFDPAKKYCKDSKSVTELPQCDGMYYDPATQYCKEDKFLANMPKCKDSYYNPELQICDNRDGQIYKIVKIGWLIWMAENLNFNSNFLPENAEDSVYNSKCRDDNEENCAKYGRLYLWSAAVDSAENYHPEGKGCGYGSESCGIEENYARGICPEGFHLPSTDDATLLYDDKSAAELKSRTGWSEGSNGTDVDGFSVYPSDLGDDGLYAAFWTSVGIDENNAYAFILKDQGEARSKSDKMKNHYFSIRCVREDESGPLG